MSTDKANLRAVSTTMHMAPRRDSGHLTPKGVEHIQRSEEMLLTLSSRQLLAAFLAWNEAGRPVFDPLAFETHTIPGTSSEEERSRRGRYSRSPFK